MNNNTQMPPEGGQPQVFENPAPQAPRNNTATLALVFGIVALVAPILAFASCCFPAAGFLAFLPVVGLVAGILGIIWTQKAKKQGENTTAALVLAIIGLVLSGITFFSCTICVGCVSCLGCAAGGALEELGDLDPSQLEDLLESMM